MHVRKHLSASVSALLSLSIVGTALAAFPDVPAGHLYRSQIDALVSAGVVNGNPDGNFYPEKSVNRAEMLKMLYKAKGIVPDVTSKTCFKDVAGGSWYESYVCDAVGRKFVSGYSDGTFKPANPVNRVEALKMLMLVFDFDVPEVSDDDRDLVKFVDVSPSGWYVKYLVAAFKKGILPIAGQDASHFYPDWALLRGEAAAYIYNGLNVSLKDTRASSSSSSSSTRTNASASSADENGPVSVDASYPFTTSGKFTKKQPYSYLFEMTKMTTVEIVTRLQSGQQGGLTCRLYLLKDSGFSDQYYLGYEENDACYITATLSPGSYQLQLQPTVADTTFTVDVRAGSGDNNDGFPDAGLLRLNVTHTQLLDSRDIYDFYTFTVGTEENMKVEMSNATNLDCIVYAMSDVDIYGFSGPQCNQNYSYRPGTYYVAVKRKTTLGSKQTYTLKLTK